MADKKELYNRIKIAGMISYIPVMLAVFPLSGFLLGDYLQKKFNLPFYFMIICVGIGIAAGVRESVRIIKRVREIDKKG